MRDLPPEVREGPEETPGGPLDLKGNEPALIREALRRFNGNRKRAAAALNIGPVTLWRKMKRLGPIPGLGEAAGSGGGRGAVGSKAGIVASLHVPTTVS